MGLFLILSPGPNVRKGWIQGLELQTFVTHRKVEGRKALVQRNRRWWPPRGPRGAAAARAHGMQCTLCTSAAAGDAAARASGSRAAPTGAGDGGEDAGSRRQHRNGNSDVLLPWI